MAATHVYVGIKPCGCVVAAAIDDPRWTDDTAKFVASNIKDGRKVERHEIDWLTGKLRRCDCPKEAR